MNTTTIIQTVAAIVLLSASQVADAGKLSGRVSGQVSGLDALMRANHAQAHAAIQADIRASIKATPLILDEPGVSTGKVEIIAEVEVDAGVDANSAAATDQPASQEIRLDILNKALATPGLFGVYRYVTATAAKAAVIVVK